jgi:histidyl-tRNA synthetase
METKTVKGFKDFTGKEAEKREQIRKILVKCFKQYGFEPAETPIIEYREFVKGDNSDDEAVSEVFKLKDKGGRDLALRYEFTFQLKRLMEGKKLPYKRYSIGPVFRDEPVSGNRLRQFVQCDVDTIGSTVKDEAEVLAIVKRVLNELGIKFKIYINNRKLLNEILEKENIEKTDWERVIREIDKLDKQDEDEIFNNLRGFNAQGLLEIFKKKESFFKKYSNYAEIEELRKYCSFYGVDVIFSPTLARGLSYYNGSVFEVKGELKETITAGGSYMFNKVQSTGLSFGLDRLSLICNIKNNDEKVLIISIEKEKEAIELSEKLRNAGINCLVSFNKISKSLEYANSQKIEKVLFVGEKEIKEKRVKFKNMKTGKEESLKLDDIAKKLK